MAAARHRMNDEGLSLFAPEGDTGPRKSPLRPVAAKPKSVPVTPAPAAASLPSSGQPPRRTAPGHATAVGDGNGRRMYTIDEAAAICHVSTKTISRYIKKRQLVAYKVGHSVRIWPDDLYRWIHAKGGDASAADAMSPRPSWRVDPATAVRREEQGGEA